jgi:hypothetical protein
MRDSAIVLITVAWVVAFIVVVSGLDLGDDASPTPPPGPVDLPTEVWFGSSVDDDGLLDERRTRFDAGSTLAYVVWLGSPLGTPEVQVEVLRLRADAGTDVMWRAEPLATDPRAHHVRGTISDELLAEWGRGSYRLRILDDNAPIAAGTFQYDTEVPETITGFADRLDAILRPGEHIGYRFSEEGMVIEERPLELAEPTPVLVVRRATFNGTDYLLVVEGIEGRYWLPEAGVTLLDEVS